MVSEGRMDVSTGRVARNGFVGGGWIDSVQREGAIPFSARKKPSGL